jgi:CBS domain-containing protein
MTTDELARYLTEREISGAPVVDGRGHLIGVVSMTDIGRHLAEPSDFASSQHARRRSGGLAARNHHRAARPAFR